MSQPPSAGQLAPADQLMRRMLNAVARLEAACAADAAELVKIRDQRTRDMTEAEKAARSNAQRDIDGAAGLGAPMFVGSELRNELAKFPSLETSTSTPGRRQTTWSPQYGSGSP